MKQLGIYSYFFGAPLCIPVIPLTLIHSLSTDLSTLYYIWLLVSSVTLDCDILEARDLVLFTYELQAQFGAWQRVTTQQIL